jgi:hypothetical protein
MTGNDDVGASRCNGRPPPDSALEPWKAEPGVATEPELPGRIRNRLAPVALTPPPAVERDLSG